MFASMRNTKAHAVEHLFEMPFCQALRLFHIPTRLCFEYLGLRLDQGHVEQNLRLRDTR